MMGMCTSSKITQINQFTMYNIELSNNLFRYINRPIFINNSTFSEYIIINDNFNNYPQYVKKEVYSHVNMQEGLNILANYMKEAYLKSLYACNFNDPCVLYDIQYQYYKLEKMDPIPKLKYRIDIEYLRQRNIANKDIIDLVENMLKGKNIDGENLFKINHIKY